MRNDARSLHRARIATAVLRLMEARRGEVAAMLESCGISPRDVPLDSAVWRDGPRIRMERFVRDEETGNIRLCEDGAWVMVEDFSFEPDWVPDWIPLD